MDGRRTTGGGNAISLTGHAERRGNQRGIRMDDIGLVLAYGSKIGPMEYLVSAKAKARALGGIKKRIREAERAKGPDGPDEVRRLREQVQRFDKLAGKTVVVDEERGEFRVVTAYHTEPGKLRSKLRYGRKKGFRA